MADAYAFQIRVFGPDGSILFRFGRDGAGPGEFGNLNSLAWAGDTLLTLDLRVGRVGVFDASGHWHGEYRLPGSVTGQGPEFHFY